VTADSVQPSIAHTRCGHPATEARIAWWPSAVVANRPPPRIVSSPAITSIVIDPSDARYGTDTHRPATAVSLPPLL
jgi:hypothetical protein